MKYKKCHELLEDHGYLVLFWYTPCGDKSFAAKEIDKKRMRLLKNTLLIILAPRIYPKDALMMEYQAMTQGEENSNRPAYLI